MFIFGVKEQKKQLEALIGIILCLGMVVAKDTGMNTNTITNVIGASQVSPGSKAKNEGKTTFEALGGTENNFAVQKKAKRDNIEHENKLKPETNNNKGFADTLKEKIVNQDTPELKGEAKTEEKTTDSKEKSPEAVNQDLNNIVQSCPVQPIILDNSNPKASEETISDEATPVLDGIFKSAAEPQESQAPQAQSLVADETAAVENKPLLTVAGAVVRENSSEPEAILPDKLNAATLQATPEIMEKLTQIESSTPEKAQNQQLNTEKPIETAVTGDKSGQSDAINNMVLAEQSPTKSPDGTPVSLQNATDSLPNTPEVSSENAQNLSQNESESLKRNIKPVVPGNSSEKGENTTTILDNTQNTPGTNKIAHTQEQLSNNNAQNQDHKDLSANRGSNPSTELPAQAVSNNRPMLSEIASNPAPQANSSASVNHGRAISQQIQESILSSYQPGSKQIVIQLNPVHLGKVEMKFQENADGITGVLHVSKPQTQDDIQRAIPEMLRNLQDSGIQMRKIEVVLTNQQSYGDTKEQSFSSGQGGNPGNPESSNSKSTANNIQYNKWGANSPEFDNDSGHFTDKSINMLV